MRKLVAAFALVIASIQPLNSNAETPYGIKDVRVAATYPLGPCATATELDCIESIEVISNSGSAERATFDRFAPEIVTAAQNGNTVVDGVTYWKVGARELRLNLMIETPEHVIYIRPDGFKARGAAMRGFIKIDNPFETRIRTKVRTSWLKPMNIQIKMTDAEFAHEMIPGGNLWTFEGRATRLADYSGDWNKDPEKSAFRAKADTEVTEFSFIIHHAGKDAESSYWPPICADKGYTVQSHNTNATGDPQWNSKERSLEFSIFAPHLRVDGSKNVGYFQLWTTHEFINCKFPDNDLTTSPKLIVQILYEDGTVGVATTSVKNADGKLTFTAAGFHFSAPKVVVKRDASVAIPSSPASSAQSTSPMPSLTPSPMPSIPSNASKTTITSSKAKQIACRKGAKKITLKVGQSRCPKGYVKVSTN